MLGDWSWGHYLIAFAVLAGMAGVIKLAAMFGDDDPETSATPAAHGREVDSDSERAQYAARLVNVLARARDRA